MTGPTRRYAGAVALALTLAVATGCTSDPNSVEAQAKAGDNKGYVAGDGSFEVIAPESRGAAVELSGPTIEGGTWSSPDHRGSVVVLNKWGSWCAPCVAEMPTLEKVREALVASKKPVVFVGLNFDEPPANGRAFAESINLGYPSLSDESGLLLLALQGKAQATPTTLILDRQGRIAARISGAAQEKTLSGLIDDVVAES